MNGNHSTINYPRDNALKIRDEMMGDSVIHLLDKLVDQFGRPFEPTDVQVPLLNDRTRFQVWLMGRRCGKSTTAAVRAIIEMMKPYKRVWIVAPTYQLTEKIYRVVFQMVTRNLPFMLQGKAKNSKNEMSMTFINGSELICKSADNPDQLIGESLDLVIVDEAGVVKDEAIQILTPGLNDIDPRTGLPKGKMIAVSTPRKFNWLKEWWDLGLLSSEEQCDLLGKEDVKRFGGRVHSSHHATSFSNPHTDAVSINIDKKRLPESLWEQEYLAKWISEGGSVFPIKTEYFMPPHFRSPKLGETSFVGIDIARAHDYTVILGLNSRFEQISYKRINKTDWKVIKATIRSELEDLSSTGPVVCCIDSTGVGAPVFEDIKNYFSTNEHVKLYPVNFSKQKNTKNDIIESLRMSVADGLIRLWWYPEIKKEFVEFEYTLDSNSNPVYGAPSGEGYFDDIVTAVGLAHYATKVNVSNLTILSQN